MLVMTTLTTTSQMRATATALPTQRQAPTLAQGAPLSTITDSYQAGSSGSDVVNVRQHFQDRTQREATVRSMFKEGVGKPDAAQGQKLVGELSQIDNDVLTLVGKSGTKLAIADPGDNMQQLGMITPLTSEGIQQRLPEMKKAADRLYTESQNFGQAIDANKGVNEARGRFLDAGLNGLDKGVSMFDSPAQQIMSTLQNAPPGAGAMLQQQLAMLPETVPIEQLAATRGARTPGEVKEFTDLTKQLNGDRLGAMDQRGRASLLEQAKSADPMVSARAQQALKSGSTMINWDTETVIVPDIHYHRTPSDDFMKLPDPSQPSMRLDSHDNRVVQEWGKGHLETLPFRDENHPDGIDNGGQYLSKTKTMVLQNGAEFAAVHEVGHRVEDIVKEQDPKFYAQWNDQRQATYQRKIDGGQSTITGYALEDRGEYFAEGFSFYYKDPELLKAKDADLYNLTDQMINRARELGRQ